MHSTRLINAIDNFKIIADLCLPEIHITNTFLKFKIVFMNVASIPEGKLAHCLPLYLTVLSG